MLHFVNAFFSDGAHWHGYDGIPTRLAEHIRYCLIALAVAAAIGLPVGLVTGHYGRGGNALAFLATAARALPSFGLLVLMTIMVGFGLLPVMVPLVVLAVPPILVTTYESMRSVDPSPVDAARGMGMQESRILLQVELPVALPLILSGLRSGAIQIVSTATIAAYVGIGGPRPLHHRRALPARLQKGGGRPRAWPPALALATLVLFWTAGRFTVSRGDAARGV
ncbi:LOW QUALITY PROTEIN: proline/glycine betaine ABC transporter, permease, partial [Streptomyces sp. e14]